MVVVSWWAVCGYSAIVVELTFALQRAWWRA
jgi:hypothetical protein